MNSVAKSLLKTLRLRRKKVLSALDRNNISLGDIYFIGGDISYMRDHIYDIYISKHKITHNQFLLLESWLLEFEVYVFRRIQDDYSTYILNRL